MTKTLPPMIICGTVRNGAGGLSSTLYSLEEIENACERSVGIIVTNDNTDGTDDILREWEASSSSRILIRLDGALNAFPHRLDRLAFARNAYLSKVFDTGFDAFSTVCIVDLDGPNRGICAIDIMKAMSASDDWDALFANQRQCYYDIYALRHKNWCPNDCWREVAKASNLPPSRISRKWAIRRFVYNRQFHISPLRGLIAVESAFGGLAIYRRSALRNSWYAARDGYGNPVCEHVILHRQMLANGAKLFIAPMLLNDAPPEHLGPGSGRPLPANYATTHPTSTYLHHR